ncbi:MAG: hypothetical protein IMW98_06915 [Firmicutes bacterium]|nr:hypothetical protein [Bacillota bacterium]
MILPLAGLGMYGRTAGLRAVPAALAHDGRARAGRRAARLRAFWHTGEWQIRKEGFP